MLKKLQKHNSEGFTIIEVLIVLAIAALILVIVLVAVPNLQRSQRNSARKSEASRILTAADTVVSNNNGAPLTGTEASSILQEAGSTAGSNSLKQLAKADGTPLTAGASASTAMTADTLNVGVVTANGSVAYSTNNKDAVLVLENASCGSAGAYTYAPRSIVVLYSEETSGGGRTPLCVGS